uniref:Uncharacterized protein n=1 Tax=Avena sativa TaxID=4498 RepID=A0ACD5YMT3_AVESA
MASMSSPRLPFLPARAHSAAVSVTAAATSSSSSPPPRRALKCSCASGANSVHPSAASRPPAPVVGGVGSADLNGLRAPPIPVTESPLPAYRDPHGLPRPLTSADLMGTNGETLKVAYQGFPGAYSEAAAKKAYPNCQTVPCEHFDTAFQVS